MLKKLFVSFLYFLLIFLSLNMIYTILNYFNLLSYNILRIIKYIIPIISIIISSFILGRNSFKKGYIEGIKLGLIVIIFFIIICFVFDSFNYHSLFYYFIIILTSCLGSMIGINKKKDAFN